MSDPHWPLNHTGRYSHYSWLGGDSVAERQLWALLVVHEMITRAGVLAANELLSVPEMSQAIAACRYFQLDALDDLLLRIFAAPPSVEAADVLDAEYRMRLPDDEPLFAALRRKAACAPQDFGPRPP
jgi:hypothetical protein